MARCRRLLILVPMKLPKGEYDEGRGGGIDKSISSPRKKVLLLIPTLYIGGAERFFLQLSQNLDRNRFEVHLGLFQANGQFMSEVPSDVTIHDLKVSRARYSLAKIVRLVRKLRPNAVLSTLANANIAVTLVKPLLPAGTRVLLSEASSPTMVIDYEFSHPRTWKWLYRRFYKRANKVICLCNALVDEMAIHYGVPRQKIVRIPYPIDFDRIWELSENGQSPFLGPGPHLVAAGRLCYAKGFDLLLEAMPAVLRRFSGAQLTILGEGSLRGELEERARNLGLLDVVSFLRFERNPWRYFRHADLFVLSSHYEGMPNVLLEAFGLNARVVATECSGAIRELAASYPKMTIVPAANPAALSSAIVSVCERSNGTESQPDLGRFRLEQVMAEYSALLWE